MNPTLIFRLTLLVMVSVFAADPATAQSVTILHNFSNLQTDGFTPSAAPVLGADGNFYGVTFNGGTNNIGKLYKITPQGQFTVLHGFYDGTVPNDGYYPTSLVLGNDGNFYGTNYLGGSTGVGMVFKLTPGGSYSVVYSFGSISGDGNYPNGVIQAADGNLYATTYYGGANNKGAVVQINPGTGGGVVLHSFGSTNDGANPQVNLTQGPDGALYGTTDLGGSVNDGTVFKISTDGSTYQVLHNFVDGSVPGDGYGTPGALVLAPDGNFYGTTYQGGLLGDGILYKITPQGTETVLYQFGSASGSYIGVNPGHPYTSYCNGVDLMIAADGNFYGTTYTSQLTGKGTIYKMTPQGAVTFLHNFGDGTVPSDGTTIFNGLAQGTDGNLYGTTTGGGTGNGGTFFKLTLGAPVLTSPLTASGSVGTPFSYQITATNLPTGYAATGLPGGLTINSTGLISGTPTAAATTTATVTLINSIGSTAVPLPFTIAAAPAPTLTSYPFVFGLVNTSFSYQITATGSATSFGASSLPAGLGVNAAGLISGSVTSPVSGNAVISATNSKGTTQETISYQFFPSSPTLGQEYGTLANLGNFGSGGSPGSPLNQNFDGTLEGVCRGGPGLVYNLTLTGAGTPTLQIFQGGLSTNVMDTVGIMQATDGNFYGMANGGGAYGRGVIYKMTPLGVISILHDFGDLTDGSLLGTNHGYNLVEASDGNLYGTTPRGGTDAIGIIFRITPQGAYTVLHNFGGAGDGGMPFCSLIQASDGNLYGTTWNGGSAGSGTIFKVTPGGTCSVIYSFDGSAGINPVGGLVQSTDGTFYGTTSSGGTSSDGTIYHFTLPGTVVTVHSFSDGSVTNDGVDPEAGLIQGFDGNFYGTTFAGGAYSEGTAFQMTPSGGMTILHSFGNGTDGASPFDPLLQTTNGNFYGLTSADMGTVFTILANQTPTHIPVIAGPTAATLAIRTPGAFRLLLKAGAGMTTWSITGTLPPGMTLNSTTGVISGSPTVAGTSTFTLKATNPVGPVSTSVALTVVDVPTLTSPATVTLHTLNTPISYQIAATSSPTSFGAGDLPFWLSLDPASGIISGTPPTWGVYPIYPTATNLAGTGEEKVVIAVQQTQTISAFATIPSQVVSSTPITITPPTASSGLPVTVTVKSGPATISGNQVTLTAVGTVVLAADQAGNATYGAAPEVTTSFTVGKGSQSITFPTVPGQEVLGHYVLNATASSGLPVTYTVSGPATLSGSNLTFTGGGTVAVTAHQAGNVNYTVALNVQRVFAVARKGQDIGFPAIPTQTYLGPTYTLNAYSTSGLTVTYTVSGEATLSGNVLTITGAGGAQVVASQAGNTIYGAAANIIRNFRILKAAQAITFPAIPNEVVGATYSLNATASSGLALTYTVSGPATVSNGILTFTGAGTVAVTAHQAGNANFNVATNVLVKCSVTQ